MINGLNSASFYDSLSNYSLYNNTDDNLYTNPYTNIQSEIANPVETGDLFAENQSLFDITDFESTSVAEMQESVEEFETSINDLNENITELQDSFASADNTAVIEDTEAVISSYNSTLENLQESSNYNSIEAAADLSESARLAEEELNSIGIELGESGELSLNEEEFNESLENNRDQVNSVLASESGFLSELSQKVSNLEEEPPTSFMDFGSEMTLYSAGDSYQNLLENGLIVDLYS